MVTRFNCGCAYRTISDTAVFCPAHRDHAKPGFITGRETIRVPQGENPQMEKLEILMNTSGNSLHAETIVLDSNHNDWGGDPGSVTIQAEDFP